MKEGMFPILILIFAWQSNTRIARAETFSWPQAAKLALKQNFSLNSSRHQLQAARAGEGVAAANFWPGVNLNGSISHSGLQPYAQAGGWNGLGFSDAAGPLVDTPSYQFGVSASYRLFNGFADLAGFRQAEDVVTEREAAYANDSASLRLQLHQAFNQLLFTEQNMDLLKVIKERLHQETRYLQLKYQSGQEARWAYSQAQSDESQIDWQIKENTLNLQAQRAQLGAYLGLSANASVDLQVTGDLITQAPPDDFQSVLPLLDKNPSVVQQRAVVAASQAALWQSQSSRYPVLSANAGYLYQDGGAWPPSSSLWSVGLSLNYNLFSGFGQEAGIRQAAENLMVNQDALQDLLNNLQAQLYQAWASYHSAYQRVPLSKFQLDVSQERLNTEEKLYQAGNVSFFEYSQAQNQLTQSQQQALSVRLDAMQAAASYDKSLGLDLESVQETVSDAQP